MRRRTVLAATALAVTAFIAVGPTLAAYAASPTDSGDELTQQLAAGISTDSPEYAEVASSPGFHYAALTEGSPLEASTTASAADPDTAIATPNVTAGDCQFEGRGDYPHVTNGEASVHGYWVKLGGTCPWTAKVTVDLQAYACNSLYCFWVTQATQSGTYHTGPGTGYWATPHKACASTKTVGWRGQIDVDLTSVNDPSGYQYSAERDLSCSP